MFVNLIISYCGATIRQWANNTLYYSTISSYLTPIWSNNILSTILAEVIRIYIISTLLRHVCTIIFYIWTNNFRRTWTVITKTFDLQANFYLTSVLFVTNTQSLSASYTYSPNNNIKQTRYYYAVVIGVPLGLIHVLMLLYICTK